MAKLNRITFGRVIGHCVSQGMTAGEWEIEKLDELINIEVAGRADAADVDKLLALMAQGTQKIEAIKQYRAMTGQGLKEAKDAVERYWISKAAEPIPYAPPQSAFKD